MGKQVIELPKTSKEYINLTPELYRHCLMYMNLRKYTEKTKVQYVREIKSLFQNKILTQNQYSKYYQKGHSYRAILGIILKTCWFYDFPYYNYKVVTQTKSSEEKDLNSDMEKIFTEEEVMNLSNKIINGLMIDCAYFIGAGLRFSSVVRLKWADFLWEEWKDKKKTGKCLVHAKGNKKAYLPVHPYLMNKLHDIAELNNKLFLDVPYKNFDGENYLFLDEKILNLRIESLKRENFNKVLDNLPEKELSINLLERAILEQSDKIYESIKYEMNKHSKDFGVHRIRFHTFRKSSATRLLNKGWPLLKIKVLLMHESISTTEIYTKVNELEIETDYEKTFSFQ